MILFCLTKFLKSIRAIRRANFGAKFYLIKSWLILLKLFYIFIRYLIQNTLKFEPNWTTFCKIKFSSEFWHIFFESHLSKRAAPVQRSFLLAAWACFMLHLLPKLSDNNSTTILTNMHIFSVLIPNSSVRVFLLANFQNLQICKSFEFDPMAFIAKITIRY